jgi:hypothetical protein
MENRMIFERNLLALSVSNSRLCARLSAAQTTRGRYRFLSARTQELVPAAVDASGTARSLHSLVDPRKEAVRVVSTVKGGGLLILFGLGGGYVAEAALDRGDIHALIVVEYDLDGIAELLATKEYLRLFGDPRFYLLVDPEPQDIEAAILETYRPALSGGIAVLPLRARTDILNDRFNAAADTVKATIDAISDDYSVQAYFGKRWFANAIRNLLAADAPVVPLPPARRIAIAAAGPSLDQQLKRLAQERKALFLLATDTSLPALLSAGIPPDAVISIDCQHISYYHFMDGYPASAPLFLDLASPPVVASRVSAPRFFSGGHPLTVYAASRWRSFPRIDTSGGNVTYAAVSLADALGAELIELYGADFSYPEGEPYARGTYIHPYFQRAQNRTLPLEGLFANFVFRNDTLRIERQDQSWRYETKPLAAYRDRLEKLASHLQGDLVPIKGRGAPISVPPARSRRHGTIPALSPGKANMGGREFLSLYAEEIRALPPLTGSVASYFNSLDDDQRDVLMTLLPSAAPIRRRTPDLTPGETLEEVRAYCLEELGRVLAARGPDPTIA